MDTKIVKLLEAAIVNDVEYFVKNLRDFVVLLENYKKMEEGIRDLSTWTYGYSGRDFHAEVMRILSQVEGSHDG